MSTSGGLLESLKRLAGTLLSIVQTRLELLSNEVEEELLRIGQILLYGVVALFFFCLTIVLLLAFIVAASGESYRVEVLGGLAAFFLAAGLLVAYAARRLVRAKSRLFSGSLAELSKDRDRLAPPL